MGIGALGRRNGRSEEGGAWQSRLPDRRPRRGRRPDSLALHPMAPPAAERRSRRRPLDRSHPDRRGPRSRPRSLRPLRLGGAWHPGPGRAHSHFGGQRLLSLRAQPDVRRGHRPDLRPGRALRQLGRLPSTGSSSPSPSTPSCVSTRSRRYARPTARNTPPTAPPRRAGSLGSGARPSKPDRRTMPFAVSYRVHRRTR